MKTIALLPINSNIEERNLDVRPMLSFPDSAIVKNGNPVFIPDFDSKFSAHLWIALKISRLGKSIAPRFSRRYFSEIAPVITIQADSLLSALQEAGLPWTSATGFDKSVCIGNFIEANEYFENPDFIIQTVEAAKDDEITPSTSSALLPSVSEESMWETVSEVSRYNSLKMGDLILVPLSFSLENLKIDSFIKILWGDQILLKLPIK